MGVVMKSREQIVDRLAVVLISEPKIKLELKEYYELADKLVRELVKEGIFDASPFLAFLSS